MPAEPSVLRIIEAHRASTEALRARVLNALERLWAVQPGWHDVDVVRWLGSVVPLMEGAQVQTAAVTDAYLARIEAEILAVPARPVGVPTEVVSTQGLRGVPATEVWQRPAVTVRTALSEGLDLRTAADRGFNRVRELAETNLQLAETHATRHVHQAKRNVAGYRRVPRGRSCPLCLLASTQRYHKAELMPIHPGCHCKTHTIYGSHDPGQVLDPAGVDAVHQAVADFTGQPVDRAATAVDYRKFVVTHDHGEIGPVLARRGQDWTGPRDIKTERARSREAASIDKAKAAPAGTDATDPRVQGILNLQPLKS